MKKFNFILVSMVLFVFYGCMNERTSRNDVDSETESVVFDELKQEFREVYYRFPSSDEMFTYIDNTGLQFEEALLSSCRNSDTYLETRDQALNLGVYIADLAYISLFQRYKESDEYLKTIYELSDKLRISAAFDKNLLGRIERNIKNSDSLDVISDAAQDRIFNYLSRNQKEDVFALISIGGFVEVMNISMHLSNEYANDNVIIKRISDQKLVYENILKFTQQYAENDRNIKDVLELIRPLTSFFGHLKTETQKTTVAKSSEGKLVFGGGSKTLLSKNEFDQLKEIILGIRSQIISANF